MSIKIILKSKVNRTNTWSKVFGEENAHEKNTDQPLLNKISLVKKFPCKANQLKKLNL
jgi:ABC-type phosphate/phosphonate transport system ATPase subunit